MEIIDTVDIDITEAIEFYETIIDSYGTVSMSFRGELFEFFMMAIEEKM